MELKIATLEDLDDILDMVVNYHLVSIYKNDPFDTPKVSNMLLSFIVDPTKLVLLLTVEEKPIGLLIAVSQDQMFNTQKIAAELVWWVEPNYRGRESMKLIDGYEYWANKLGCVYTQLGSLEADNVEKLDKIYTNRGYACIERAYIKKCQ